MTTFSFSMGSTFSLNSFDSAFDSADSTPDYKNSLFQNFEKDAFPGTITTNAIDTNTTNTIDNKNTTNTIDNKNNTNAIDNKNTTNTNTSILDIPLDAWVVIMRYIDRNNLVKTYNNIFGSNALNIPTREKLNTFWILVSQARMLDKLEEICELPNVDFFKQTFSKLTEMGMHKDQALNIVRASNGNLEKAFRILGWD